MYHDDCTESIDSTGKRASEHACVRFIISYTRKPEPKGSTWRILLQFTVCMRDSISWADFLSALVGRGGSILCIYQMCIMCAGVKTES